MCKEIGFQLALQQHAPLLANVVAVDLGLDDPNGPSAVLAQTMEVLGRDSSDGANVVYMYLLSACEKLFDNELDQATFEEHMRWFFGTKVCFPVATLLNSKLMIIIGLSSIHFRQVNYGTHQTGMFFLLLKLQSDAQKT